MHKILPYHGSGTFTEMLSTIMATELNFVNFTTTSDGLTSAPFNITPKTNESYDLEDLMGPRRDPLSTAISMTFVYTLILVTGVIGNICTCVVISRNRYMHTATNYYLFSLAVSDLLLLVLGLPQDIYQLWNKYPYIFGETFCVLRGWTSETSTNASILTITAFTVERYLAICHPLRAHTMSRLSRAVKFIIVIWICGALCAITMAYQLGIQYEKDHADDPISDTAHCGIKHKLSHAFEIATAIFFIFPASLLSVLYVLIALQLRRSTDVGRKHNGQAHSASNGVKGQGKTLNRQSSKGQKSSSSSRKAVVKMLVAVVVAFFLCWAPFHAQRLMAIYVTEPTQADIRTFNVLTNISGVTYYVSATINPILYSIMSLKFRHAFRDTLTRCLGRRTQRKERTRLTSLYNSTLRSAAYDATDLTLVSESPQEDSKPNATHRPSRPSRVVMEQLAVRIPEETIKGGTDVKVIRSSISNSSLQMMDDDAFNEVDITEFIDSAERLG